MKDSINELFNYTQWANTELLNFLNEKNIVNDRIDMLMSHMAIVQDLWLKRLNNEDYEISDTWEKWHYDEYSKSIHKNDQEILAYVNDIDDEKLMSNVDYKNAQGVHYIRAIQHILFHWVNDCTYHRAQVGLLIREDSSYIPPATDFIYYETDKK